MTVLDKIIARIKSERRTPAVLDALDLRRQNNQRK
jgi:hypothetical protein